MKTVQKIKEVMKDEIISGNDKCTIYKKSLITMTLSKPASGGRKSRRDVA
jgi:hypothetical protein